MSKLDMSLTCSCLSIILLGSSLTNMNFLEASPHIAKSNLSFGTFRNLIQTKTRCKFPAILTPELSFSHCGFLPFPIFWFFLTNEIRQNFIVFVLKFSST